MKPVLTILVVLSVAAVVAAEITPLAPKAGAFIGTGDLFVAVKYTSPKTVRHVRVYFDDVNVSSRLRREGNTVVFLPDEALLQSPDLVGPHVVTVALYERFFRLIEHAAFRFYVVNADSLSVEEQNAMIDAGRALEPVTPVELVAAGRVYAGVEYVSVQDSGRLVARVDGHGGGHAGPWSYATNFAFTTDNGEHLQSPQRFQVTSSLGTVLRLGIGDNWPVSNPYLVSDQRVRGLELNLSSPRQVFGLDMAYGEIKRAVEPYLSDEEGLYRALEKDTTGVFDRNDSLAFFTDGTYRRMLLSSRLHVGSGRTVKVGLGFVKAKDRPGSIDQVRYADSAPGSGGDSTVTVRGLAGETPKDNLVVGADCQISLWKQRVALFSHWALSYLTQDISDGPITKDSIRSRAGDEVTMPLWPEDIRGILVLNETTVPLLISDARSVGSSMAWDAGLRLDLPLGSVRNDLEVTYFHVGPNYRSLANEVLSVNRAGVRVTDALHLLGGRMSLRGAMRYYHDLMPDVKPSSYRHIDFSLSGSLHWSAALPSLTMHFMTGTGERATTPRSLADNRNQLTTMGSTLHYARVIGHARTTWSLSYGNANYLNRAVTRVAGSSGDSTAVLRIGLRSHSLALTGHGTFDHLPFDTRASVGSNLAKGDYGLGQTHMSGGLSWHIIEEVLQMSGDLGYKHTNDRDDAPVNEWDVMGRAAYTVSEHISMHGRAGLERTIGEDFIDRKLALTYEHRF